MPARLSHRPPLRYHVLTGWYDRAADWTAAASRIRARLAHRARPTRAARALDLGRGTGNLARPMVGDMPMATVVGVDPDRHALQLEACKLRPIRHQVQLVEGSAQALPSTLSEFHLVTSYLAFHHLDPEIKTQALREVYRVLKPAGRVLIAHFDRPSTALMRLLFIGVRWLDGARNTADHADCSFKRIRPAPPFEAVEPLETCEVPTGTIGLWQLRRAATVATTDCLTSLI